MNSCCKAILGNASKRMASHVAAERISAPSSRMRRSLVLTRWSLPAVVLVLLPKCPACLAAYIAVGTGVSLSVTTSSYLRGLLLGVAIAAIVLNVPWLTRRARKTKSSPWPYTRARAA
jgi:hypothetical protein